MSNAVLEAALEIAARGWPVFPCSPHTKKPMTKHGFKDASTDPAAIKAQWAKEKWPNAMIGVPTGKLSGLLTLDVDVDAEKGIDGKASLEALADGKEMPPTLAARTPRGGWHYHFAYPDSSVIHNSASKLGRGLDVRGEGGYVIVPPSVNADGKAYEWDPWGEAAALPQWILDKLRERPAAAEWRQAVAGGRFIDERLCAYGDAALDSECGKVLSAPEGERNDTLFRAACNLFELVRGGTLEESRVRDRMTYAATATGLDAIEIGATLDSAAARMTKARGPGERDGGRFASGGNGPPPGQAGDPGLKGQEEDGNGEEHNGRSTDKGADPGSELQREKVVPVDLWDAFAPPELPKRLLPSVIEDYALMQGKLIGCDPAGIAMACLAVAASAITDEIEVQVLVNNPRWKEPARLWVAIVGDVSDKKTPIIRAAIWPLDDIDAELFAVYEREMAEYEALPKEKKTKEKKPLMTHLVVNNLTIESAEEALVSNPHGILVHNDELAEWFSSMERYYGSKAASDRPFWLQTYNGGRRRVGRIVRGHKMIRNCSVCLIGGIQPDKIREIATMFADDGLLQRPLPLILRPGKLPLDAPQGNETSRYKRLIERLYRMRKQSPDMVINKRLKFDATAQQVMYRVQKANDDLSQLKSVNRKLASAIGKGDGVFARLCVLFHCIEHAHEHMLPFEISGDTAARVERFLKEFVQPHQLSFFAGILGLSDDHDNLTQIAGLILAHRLTEVTNRIVQRIGGKVKLDNWNIQKLFEQLFAFGWLLAVKRLRSNDPGTWTVNPAVHELFAERAKAEIARREAGREAIMRIRSRG